MKATFRGHGLDGVKANVQLDIRAVKVGDRVYVKQIANLEGLAPGKARPLIHNHRFKVVEKNGDDITLEAIG